MKLAPEDRGVRNGIPVTSLARTLLDLAADLPTTAVTKALEQADKLDLLDARAIDDVCARTNGHHGVGTLRRAMEHYDPRHHDTRSDLERDALPLLDAMNLPRPLINHPLGPYTVDVYWPIERVVVELDSWEHHRSRAAFERDRERDRWCARRGILCVRVTWRQLRAGGLADVAAILERRRVRAA